MHFTNTSIQKFNLLFFYKFRARTFVTQIIQFPSSIFMWHTLAQVFDENNEAESSMRLLFAHLLESIISTEFPTVKFALKVSILKMFSHKI